MLVLDDLLVFDTRDHELAGTAENAASRGPHTRELQCSYCLTSASYIIAKFVPIRSSMAGVTWKTGGHSFVFYLEETMGGF